MTTLFTTRTPRSGPPGVEERPRRGLLGRAALTAGAAAVLLGPAVAAIATGTAAQAASGDCTGTTTVTCKYGYTGGEQAFTVPAGITSVQVDAVGAAGGADNHGNPGGLGAEVTGTLTGLSGGQVLYVEVGQAPDSASTPIGARPMAFNGGGASDVRTTSIAAVPDSALTTANDSRLIVAAGGGGHSEPEGTVTEPPANAGADALPATASDAQGQGGFAGTQTAGGAGGQGAFGPCAGYIGGSGSDGSLGQGGNGSYGYPTAAGGGGGGSYCTGSPAAGGGGGSSLVPADGKDDGPSSGPASVTISYTAPAPDLSITNSGAPNPVTSGQPLTYTLTATNTGGSDATGVTVTDPLPATALFGSVHTTQGTCTRSASGGNKNKDGTVTCNLGTLTAAAPGDTATVTITITPTTKGMVTATATAGASNASSASAPATVTVNGA
jgi:uncharacterized repeat protein (TIGR01451 family)